MGSCSMGFSQQMSKMASVKRLSLCFIVLFAISWSSAVAEDPTATVPDSTVTTPVPTTQPETTATTTTPAETTSSKETTSSLPETTAGPATTTEEPQTTASGPTCPPAPVCPKCNATEIAWGLSIVIIIL